MFVFIRHRWCPSFSQFGRRPLRKISSTEWWWWRCPSWWDDGLLNELPEYQIKSIIKHTKHKRNPTLPTFSASQEFRRESSPISSHRVPSHRISSCASGFGDWHTQRSEGCAYLCSFYYACVRPKYYYYYLPEEVTYLARWQGRRHTPGTEKERAR